MKPIRHKRDQEEQENVENEDEEDGEQNEDETENSRRLTSHNETRLLELRIGGAVASGGVGAGNGVQNIGSHNHHQEVSSTNLTLSKCLIGADKLDRTKLSCHMSSSLGCSCAYEPNPDTQPMPPNKEENDKQQAGDYSEDSDKKKIKDLVGDDVVAVTSEEIAYNQLDDTIHPDGKQLSRNTSSTTLSTTTNTTNQGCNQNLDVSTTSSSTNTSNSRHRNNYLDAQLTTPPQATLGFHISGDRSMQANFVAGQQRCHQQADNMIPTNQSVTLDSRSYRAATAAANLTRNRGNCFARTGGSICLANRSGNRMTTPSAVRVLFRDQQQVIRGHVSYPGIRVAPTVRPVNQSASMIEANRRLVERQIEAIQVTDSRRWNFDFRNCQPLNQIGHRYVHCTMAYSNNRNIDNNIDNSNDNNSSNNNDNSSTITSQRNCRPLNDQNKRQEP